MTAPRVSVVVPVHDEGRTLRACIDSLLSQEHPPAEVIFVNDGSTDDTAEILASYGDRLVVLTTPGVGPSSGRNLGVARATGELVAFTDGDCVCDPGWVRELLRGFEAGGEVGGVGGDQRTPPDAAPYARRVAAFLRVFGFVGDYVKSSSGPGLVEVPHNPTCNVMYRRSVFSRVGGFLEWLWPGEDVDFDLRVRRAGFRLLYNPGAVVLHHRPESSAGFRRMMFRYGEAQGALVRLHGPFRLIQWMPVALLVAIGAAVALAWTGPLALAAGAALGLLGLGALLARRAPSAALALACARMLGPAVWEWNAGFARGIWRTPPHGPNDHPGNEDRWRTSTTTGRT